MIPLFDYDKHKLIMESSFKFEGYDFLYFDEGIPYYSLFRPTRKLNSFWEVKYAAEVLWWLNPTLEPDIFIDLICTLSDRSSGHVIRTYSEDRVVAMCEEVMELLTPPYVRRYRRIVFNDGRNISTEDKQSIVGQIIGGQARRKKVSIQKIYDTTESLMLTKDKITQSIIANELDCTRQTISSYMTSDLKDMITHHNYPPQVS